MLGIFHIQNFYSNATRIMFVKLMTRPFHFWMWQDRPENFNSLLRKLQLIGALKSKNVLPAYNLLDSLTTNVQNVISTGYQLDRSRLLGVLVSTQPCSSSAFSIFGAGKGSCWVPFDMFMENAMDGRHLHAISSVEFLTGT